MGAGPDSTGRAQAGFQSRLSPLAQSFERDTTVQLCMAAQTVDYEATFRMESTCSGQNWKTKEAWALDEGGTSTAALGGLPPDTIIPGYDFTHVSSSESLNFTTQNGSALFITVCQGLPQTLAHSQCSIILYT